MYLALHNLHTPGSATHNVVIQWDEGCAWVNPRHLPTWASPASANSALLRYDDGEGTRVYLSGLVLYVIHLEPLASLCGGLAV